MGLLILALVITALVFAAILASLVLLRIATRHLDGNPSPSPAEKAARRLLGVYVRRPGEVRDRDKVRS